MKQQKKINHNEWCALIAEQEAENISITEFCKERGLAQHRFYRHKRKMREATADRGFDEISFSQNTGIRLLLDTAGWRIDVQQGFDAGCLREVVEALR